MLSNDESNDGGTSSGLLQMKKRRIQRACDICRRKKIRCDGVQMPGNRCSNCISCRFDCTYVEAAEKRGPPKGYVESLENRAEKLEKLLRQLCPDETLFKELQASLDGNWTIERPTVSDNARQAEPNAVNLEKVASAIRGAVEGDYDPTRSLTDPQDEDDPTLDLAESLRDMAFSAPNGPRSLGKSSDGMLVRTAVALKSEYTGDDGLFGHPQTSVLRHRRADFWGVKPWEQKADATASPKYNFPDIDLALHCIDLYFKCSNLYLPLLHRPTFDKCVKERRHKMDEGFASVFLLVCAVGARYSDDPRVLLDGVNTYHSAGWTWFDQVRMMERSLLAPPTLYDLQLYCLCCKYLLGSSAPQSCWAVAGIGIRLAQDVGAHRRKDHHHIHTLDDELWNRAFWMLVCMDRMVSASLGRPCAIRDEDFDLNLPVDCDDEYWDNPDPKKCFKQPPNKPSSVTFFILYLKLHQILAFSLRTIYSTNKVQIPLGLIGKQWEQQIVVELDSALNRWVDSVPDHLRWDPNRENVNFFNQSVALFAAYYYIQIVIHRPFIPSPNKPSPLSFPSLAICANAARSCSHILDIQRARNINSPPNIQMPAFTAGIVLLMNIWGGKRSGLSIDPIKEMTDVHKCMRVLKGSEGHWYSAGRLWDVLYELTSIGELPLPQPSPPSRKREREWDNPLPTSPSESPLNPMSQNESPRILKEPAFVGQTQQPQKPLPRRPQAVSPLSATRTSHINLPPLQQEPSQKRSQSQNPQNSEYNQSISTTSSSTNADPPVFALPLYSDELGRLPVHGQVMFSAHAHHSQPQTYSPQHPQTDHWYTMSGSASTQGSDRSESTPHAGLNGASSPYWSHCPAPDPQQQQHLAHCHRPSQNIRTNGFSSTSEMSSMTAGPYGMDSAQITTDVMLDSVGATTLAFTQQQTPTYGLGPTDSPSPSVGSSSTVASPPKSSTGSSIKDVYVEMGMDIPPDLSGVHSFHQHLGAPQQQQQQPLVHPFVDNDTVDLWSNAPVGFELDDWGTYLSSVSELMQGDGSRHPSI